MNLFYIFIFLLFNILYKVLKIFLSTTIISIHLLSWFQSFPASRGETYANWLTLLPCTRSLYTVLLSSVYIYKRIYCLCVYICIHHMLYQLHNVYFTSNCVLHLVCYWPLLLVPTERYILCVRVSLMLCNFYTRLL